MLNKKLWIVLGMMAMGCAANTEAPSDASNTEETEESADSLVARKHVGTYVRIEDYKKSACNLLDRLELRANGTFAATGAPSGPVLCATIYAPALEGTWSSTASGKIALKVRGRSVASAKASADVLKFNEGQSSGLSFGGKLKKLGDDQCRTEADCGSGEQCVRPYLSPCAPGVTCNYPNPSLGVCNDVPVPPPGTSCGPDLVCNAGEVCRAYGTGACPPNQPCPEPAVVYACVPADEPTDGGTPVCMLPEGCDPVEAQDAGPSSDGGTGSGATDAGSPAVVVDAQRGR